MTVENMFLDYVVFGYAVHLNLFITVLDITWIMVGPQKAIQKLLFIYAFYFRYNTDWIANMEIGLAPMNNVIKRLWCINLNILQGMFLVLN